MSTYIEITSVTPKTTSVIANNRDLTISWTIGPRTSTNPTYIPTQESAELAWKYESEQEYTHNVSVSGSTKSVVIPAGTLQTAWYVNFRLKVYDVSGTYAYLFFSYLSLHLVELSMTAGAAVARTRPDETLEWASTLIYDYYNSAPPPVINERRALFSFSEFPSAYNFRALSHACLYGKIALTQGKVIGGYIDILSNSFDPDLVTWNTKPNDEGRAADWVFNANEASAINFKFGEIPILQHGTTQGQYSASAASMAKAKGLELVGPTNGSSNITERYIRLSDSVTLRLFFTDDTVTSKPEAVTNAEGYVNPHAAQTFKWEHVPDGDYYCYAGWTTASATLYWSSDNGSTWHSVAAEANSGEVTLAANTLPVGTVKWYVTATDDQGTTATSETYTINTTDSAHTATPVYPNSSIENGDAPIRFIWTDASDTNTAPTGADLQYSTDGSTWTTFAQPRTSTTEYVAPASTFPSGTVFWRVRSLNADGVAGSWSDGIPFICFAAPDAPIISTNGKPFLTVTWQSEGQQAYKVIVDGKIYGPYFGTGKSFTIPDFLSNGTHTVAVSIQNEYSLWSIVDPETDTGIISVTVTNVPGAAVTLSRTVDIDAELYWSGGAGTGDFAVYRDGVRIARTGQQNFTDRLCLGEHEYFVLELLPDGYYTKSNVVTAEIFVPVPQIALFSGGPWIPMEKCLEISRRYTRKREKALTHYRGLTLPVVEWGSFWDESVELSVFYEYGQQADRFAALCGNTVVIKEPDGRMMVGALSELPEDAKAFHRFFSFTGDSVEWEDLADGTQS
jgi:hypothetical protein